ncbi:LarC family nickel insertion protein [Tepidibacillus marianensis]|uniref:LarC family nickel insertion protein n=1 Tax=Tepidibacillus marianensis TaxID=3131995 RepID=UPI0030D34C77
MRVVYFDCFSGISGDMTLASLIDAGANREYIEHHLKKLPIEPFELQYHKVVKTGVTGLKIDVLLDPNTEIVHHRHYVDIVEMIDQSDLPNQVKTRSKNIFEKIGVAEAKVHNVPLDHVHFHEVGAVDSIVDIVGVCLALENLGIDHIYTSPIPLGSGQIKIDHGIYPIPTPATLEILKGIPIRSSHVPFEMTTPTGAGIVAALGMEFSGYPSMTVQTIGYGAGTKDFEDRPNVLRAVIGDTNELYVSEPQFTMVQEHEHHHDHHNPLTISE